MNHCNRRSVQQATLSESAISSIQNHPRFQEAVRVSISGQIARYSRNGLLNRVMNDRGRRIGSMIALYLHYTSVLDDNGSGFTGAAFQAFCMDLKLCSRGRARALLLMMHYANYVTPMPHGSDRRQRRLIPTEHLIEEHRLSWQRQFEAMALIMPEERVRRTLLSRPEFMAAFVHRLGTAYFAGFRVLHYAPDLARLVESNAGLLVMFSLFLSATTGAAGPSGTPVTVSLSALSVQFGIARGHARNLLADGAAAGLLRRGDETTTVIVLPRLVHAVSSFSAALFALLAHTASAAAEDVAPLL